MKYKIYCKDLVTYIDAQKYAFELGYSWGYTGNKISNTYHKYLFLYSEFLIFQSDLMENFRNTTFIEVTLEKLQQMVKDKSENFKIHCKNKDEVIEAQKYAFELGYCWEVSGTKYLKAKFKYLFLYKGIRGNYLKRSNTPLIFDENSNKEITLEELKEMTENKLEKTEFIIDDKCEVYNNYQREDDNKREAFDKLLGYFGRAY
jgi:hypothetical protein